MHRPPYITILSPLYAVYLLMPGCASTDSGPSRTKQHSPEILYLSNRDGDYEIYLMDLSKHQAVQLTENNHTEFGISWSPDGSSIVFGRWLDGNRDLYTMRHDGTGVKRITTHEAHDTTPDWSADGSKIVFTSRRDSERGEIYSMNPDGSGITRITNNDRYEEVPTWSPDGQSIAFGALTGASKEDSRLQIFVLDLRTGEECQLTHLPGHNSAPRWSPDGARIAFYGNVGQGFAGADIFVVSPDGTGLVNLTYDPEPDWQPDWSPDGQQIVWARGPGDPLEIWIMNADGSQRQPVVVTPGRNEQPHWRPTQMQHDPIRPQR